MLTISDPIIDKNMLVSEIIVSPDTKGAPTKHYVLYSVYVPNLGPGNTVWVTAQFQASGYDSHYIGIGRELIRGSSPSDVSGSRLILSGMSNIIPGTHNKVVTLFGMDFGMPAGGYYYNIIVDARGTDGGNIVQIVPGSGDCRVVVFQQTSDC